MMSFSEGAPGGCVWEEFVPLTGITSHLPKHFQHGLLTSELRLTCLASFEDHLILGTNAGLVYLSHLPSLNTVRLKCENALTRTCCLSAVRSLDDLVAAGGADGCVTVFLLPRLLQRSTGPAPRAGLGQDLKRFSVSSLHSAAITSLSWSINGLRVVSGDAAGGVGLLELDYDECQCVGRRLLTEPAPVVQLDYWKQAVAVSTEERCLVYSVPTGEVTAVGSKARKGRGRYGVTWQRAGAGVGTLPDAGDRRDKGEHASSNITKLTGPYSEKRKLVTKSDDDIHSGDDSVNRLQETTTVVLASDCIKKELPSTDQTDSTTPASTDTPVVNLNSDTTSSIWTTSADEHQPRTVLSPALGTILYTSRPGQRVWQADSSGMVHATMLIKDIARAKRIHVLDDDRPDQAEDTPTCFRFEVIHVLDSGHLILHSSDSIVIFNPSTMCVESYIYMDNFFKDVSINGDYIFILSKSSKLYCLSCRPLKFGQSAITPIKSSALLDPVVVSPSLKRLGNKLFEQSSSLLGSVARLGGAIASRVSETAVGASVVTGRTTEQQQQHYDGNLSGELNSVTKQRLVTDPYCLQAPRRHSQEDLHLSGPGNPTTDRLVQSLYEHLPGTPDPTKQVENDSEIDLPLVVRGKVRTNHKRKANGNPSPPASSKFSSPGAIRSTPNPSPAPAVSDSAPSSHGPILPSLDCPRSEETSNKSPSDLPMAPDCHGSDQHLGKEEDIEDGTEEEHELSLRTLENERKLGFLLDIECLKNSAARKVKPSEHEDFERALDNHLNRTEHYVSRDITANDNNFYCEHEPSLGISENLSRLSLNEVTASNDLTAANITSSHGQTATSLDSIFSDYTSSLCYGPPSGSSVPSLQSFSSTQILSPGDNVNTRELFADASDQDLVTLTFEDAGVTEARIVPPSVDREFSAMDASQVKKEVIDGEWMHMELPSCLKALAASDDHLMFVDSERALYVGQVKDHLSSSRRCVWGRTCLPFAPSFVFVSPSGNTLWLVESNSIYVALRQECQPRPQDSTSAKENGQQIRGHEPLKRTDDVVNNSRLEKECDASLDSNKHCDNQFSFFKYVLNTKAVASKALQVCGNDRIMFYIKDDYKAYWRPVAGGGREAPLHDDGRCFVALSCRGGLLWGLDSAAGLLFRIGQCEANPLGVGWGEMTSDSTRLSVGAARRGSGEESSSPTIFSRHNSFCMVDNCPTEEEVPMSYDEALRDTSGTSMTGELNHGNSGRRRKPRRTDVNANNPKEDQDAISDPTHLPLVVPEDNSSVALCLGGGGVGWRMTEGGNVQFRPGVSTAIPQGANTSWWQVAGSDSGGGGSRYCQLASTARLLCRAEKGSTAVTLHPVRCKGSVWSTVGSDRWSMVSAESLFGGHGSLACLCPTGALMMVNPATAVATSMSLPDRSPAVSVCQRPEVLWLLTATGGVWMRAGLSATAMLGSHWQQLDLHQISDVHLCHLSLGTEVAWAVDTRGGVYMRQGALDPPHPSACPQAWLQVDNVPLPGGAVITKVFAGPARQLVWALDSHQRVLVRVAIFPELPIGIAWEYAPGIRVLHLSISEDGSVYCVTVRGAIYRREGVNPPHNYVGTRWVRLPGSLARLSASVDGRLWGLDDSGRLLLHRCLHSTRWKTALGEEGEQESVEREQEEGWEVV